MNGPSLETLGEFDSEGYAEIVAEALAEKAAPREYVIVQDRNGEILTCVFYAYGEDELQQRLQEMPSSESYRVFSRIKV